MGWISPTGFEDPNSTWLNEYRAYDDDEETATTKKWPSGAADRWDGFLILTLGSGITSTGVRFKPHQGWEYMTIVDVDVWDIVAEEWVDVYEGVPVWDEWNEITFDSRTISKARIAFYATVEETHYYDILYEFDFWEVPAVVGRSFGFIFG